MMDRRGLHYLSIAFVLAASAEAIAAPNCQLAQIADWPVKLIADHLVVDGSVNGKKVGVALDTGGVSSITRPAADRLGLTRRTARGYRIYGVGGEGYVESSLVDEFSVGELTRKNWDVMVAGDRDLGPSIEVILGEDVFSQVDLEFDLHHGRVRLFRAKGCEGIALAYWAPQGASQVDLGQSPQIVVPVKLNGQPVQAILDSGAPFSVLDKTAAVRLGIGPDSPGVAGAGKTAGVGESLVNLWYTPLRSFAIGDEVINDTVIRFADLFKDATYTTRYASRIQQKIEFLPEMLLGADFLRAHRVYVAHSQRRMYFTYEGGPVFQPKPAVQQKNAPTEQRDAKPSDAQEPKAEKN
jgi:predicted aspartyl protease